jgi:hypothetical protein
MNLTGRIPRFACVFSYVDNLYLDIGLSPGVHVKGPIQPRRADPLASWPTPPLEQTILRAYMCLYIRMHPLRFPTELLPADYCQLELVLRPAEYDSETDWKRDKCLTGKALIRKARESDDMHYC